jgi:hypothetical protein
MPDAPRDRSHLELGAQLYRERHAQPSETRCLDRGRELYRTRTRAPGGDGHEHHWPDADAQADTQWRRKTVLDAAARQRRARAIRRPEEDGDAASPSGGGTPSHSSS